MQFGRALIHATPKTKKNRRKPARKPISSFIHAF